MSEFERRPQRCLVCHEIADTEADLCRTCVASGCSQENDTITVTLTLDLPDWLSDPPESHTTAPVSDPVAPDVAQEVQR